MATAPDFTKATIEVLAKRAAQTCSNPDCRRPTSAAHTDGRRAVLLGEAAHIKGARPTSKRFDANMTDEERADASNGIWLCCNCAKVIDSDDVRFPVELLRDWKRGHEAWVDTGRPRESATREIRVTDGGIGSRIINEGPGTAVEVVGAPGQTAERIEVRGRGTGEIIVNTGPGTAKIVRSSGATASESRVMVDQPVRQAFACMSKLTIAVCDRCKNQFTARKVVHAFAGDQEPREQAKCPNCGWAIWV